MTASASRMFGELIGDLAVHHVSPSDGRAVAHGLYVAALATTITADWDLLVRRFSAEFVAPVHMGDELEITATVRTVDDAGPLGFTVETAFSIRDQAGREVARGSSFGLIPPRQLSPTRRETSPNHPTETSNT